MGEVDADVAIVGAGAAGLATAIFTRRDAPSAGVVLLDGAARPGAKILVSGGSRCNVTNATVTERDFNGGKPAVIRRVLRALPVPDTIAFFDQAGVTLHEEAHGKLFPDTNRSRDVLDALLREAEAAGVRLSAGVRVTGVERQGDAFRLATSRGELRSAFVVLATGGRSLPKSGSDGAGLDIARSLGHTIVDTTPALVPLILADGERPLHAELSGVSHEVELALWVDGVLRRRISGSLLWTHFGISGPAALDMSRHWLRVQSEGHAPVLTLSFCPGETFETVDARWVRLTADRPRASLATALAQVVPASVALALLERLAIDGSSPLARFSRDDRRRLSHALTAWPVPVSGSRGYNYAEATAGGVSLGEIDPATLRSRQCEGLYLVGEILDVDGRLGGFNFQWAWSSARAAATGIAREIARRGLGQEVRERLGQQVQ